jgi:chemotaxis protein MotB
MSKRKRAPQHADHERWLVSYADFMTLLFALFVVLFASSQHDKNSVQKVSKAVKDGFQELGAFGNSPLPIGITNLPENTPVIDTTELQAKLNQALGKEIARKEVVLRSTPDGFVISLHELGFFDSGQAVLLPGASETIKHIAGILMQYGLDMRVEGHSDNVPIHNATFASNWALSVARSTAVASMLLNDSGFDPKRMSIAGYAEYHPAATNDTPEGRRSNRRVDLVIISSNPKLAAQSPVQKSALAH